MTYTVNPQVPSNFFTPGRRVAVDLIVLHTAETREASDVDEAVAQWYHTETTDHASATGCFDDDSYTPMVGPDDVAWHAGKTVVNERSEGYEHAGKAGQTASDWADVFSQKMLRNSADFIGKRCAIRGIPVMRLTPAQVAAGMSGICDHKTVTDAYNVPGGHWDVGPNFPWDQYLAWVAISAAGGDVFTASDLPPLSESTFQESDVKNALIALPHVGYGLYEAIYDPQLKDATGAVRDPLIVGVVQHGPNPATDPTWWLGQSLEGLRAQVRAGTVVITGRARPDNTVCELTHCFVTVA